MFPCWKVSCAIVRIRFSPLIPTSPETAAAALEAGAEIVNDVSGFLWDEAMAQVCAATRCGVVLMHTRGRPEEWHALPALDPNQVVFHVRQALQQRLQQALEAGIEAERIVIDPGFGFGIVFDQNYSLLAGLEELSTLGQPLLVGVSRKGFLGRTLAPLHGGVDAPAGAAAERLFGCRDRGHPDGCTTGKGP